MLLMTIFFLCELLDDPCELDDLDVLSVVFGGVNELLSVLDKLLSAPDELVYVPDKLLFVLDEPFFIVVC
jgi:hypothetical protein